MAFAEEKIFTIEDVYALPEGERAELLDGQLYMMSAPGTTHQSLVMRIGAEIFNYIEQKGGDCRVFPAPFAVLLRDDTEYVEPDVTVVCDPGKLDEKGCHGAPDWVIEVVSPSSRSRDYLVKLFKYRTEGVREYWIVDPEQDQVTVYHFETDEVRSYSMKDAVPSGIYEDLELRLQ